MPALSLRADDLGGSRASMREQNEIAKEHDFTFLRTAAQVREFVEKERLVPVVANTDLLVSKVSFPYTRPIIKTFIERQPRDEVPEIRRLGHEPRHCGEYGG